MPQTEVTKVRASHSIFINFKKMTVAASTIFALSSCQSMQMPNLEGFQSAPGPAPSMAPAPLPTFYVGDKYYFSNGAREQVVSLDGEMVNMINVSQRKLTKFRNFALPDPYIEGATKEYFKQSNTTADMLWPLSLGKSERFTTLVHSASKDSDFTSDFAQKWSCEVAGTEHIHVLAGEFDTYRVQCKRFSISGKWWQSRTWYYAPAIGTYVMRRDFYKSGGKEYIRQLTAVRPSLQNESETVRQGIIHAWQMALEYKNSGEVQNWTDKATGTSVQVEPLTTYQAQNGLYCRTYKQLLTRKGETRTYMGAACRTGKLKWRTPTRV